MQKTGDGKDEAAQGSGMSPAQRHRALVDSPLQPDCSRLLFIHVHKGGEKKNTHTHTLSPKTGLNSKPAAGRQNRAESGPAAGGQNRAGAYSCCRQTEPGRSRHHHQDPTGNEAALVFVNKINSHKRQTNQSALLFSGREVI